MKSSLWIRLESMINYVAYSVVKKTDVFLGRNPGVDQRGFTKVMNACGLRLVPRCTKKCCGTDLETGVLAPGLESVALALVQRYEPVLSWHRQISHFPHQ